MLTTHRQSTGIFIFNLMNQILLPKPVPIPDPGLPYGSPAPIPARGSSIFSTLRQHPSSWDIAQQRICVNFYRYLPSLSIITDIYRYLIFLSVNIGIYRYFFVSINIDITKILQISIFVVKTDRHLPIIFDEKYR